MNVFKCEESKIQAGKLVVESNCKRFDKNVIEISKEGIKVASDHFYK